MLEFQDYGLRTVPENLQTRFSLGNGQQVCLPRLLRGPIRLEMNAKKMGKNGK